MASTMGSSKPIDYFSLPAKRPQNNTITTYGWDSASTSPYTDPALASSDSCDSTLPSPTSTDALIFPDQVNSYTLLKQEELGPDVKRSDHPFNFGTFEDWMRWDDPSDAALSPTSDSFYPELKIEPSSPNMSSLELQGSGVGSSQTHGMNAGINQHTSMAEEAAVFGEDPITEEPLFQTPNAMISPPMTDLPPREGLYSTPLSWTRPAAGGAQTRRSNSNSQYNGVLSPQQESQLRDIAMPSQQQQQQMSPQLQQQQQAQGGQQQYPQSPSSTSSPEPENRKKRKSSEDEEEEDDSPPPSANGRHPPVKKTAHNMIEKRYRTNLNDKIAALRDSVPSLRVMSKRNSRGEEIQEDLQGLTPAHKLNKATVLSKATEYIAHLEKRNKYLMKENSSLKSRVDAFEILVMSRQNSGQVQQQQKQQQQQRQQQQMMGRGPRGYTMDGMSGMM
jgi:hypothetical protein